MLKSQPDFREASLLMRFKRGHLLFFFLIFSVLSENL